MQSNYSLLTDVRPWRLWIADDLIIKLNYRISATHAENSGSKITTVQQRNEVENNGLPIVLSTQVWSKGNSVHDDDVAQIIDQKNCVETQSKQ